jgi:hypothetical protein
MLDTGQSKLQKIWHTTRISGQLSSDDYPVPLCISRNNEDAHEYQKLPGANFVNLDEELAGVQLCFTDGSLNLYNI